jgi:hypothetical protein
MVTVKLPGGGVEIGDREWQALVEAWDCLLFQPDGMACLRSRFTEAELEGALEARGRLFMAWLAGPASTARAHR